MRAMALSNSAAKIGQPDMWAERIAAVQKGGVAALSEATLQRWFSRTFRATPEIAALRHMLERTPAEGYTACGAAIAGTDFYTPTSGLRLPTLGIAGSEDGSTPPDLVRETINLIPGARFHLMRKAGHLPCVDHPGDYAAVLTAFLQEIGHV